MSQRNEGGAEEEEGEEQNVREREEGMKRNVGKVCRLQLYKYLKNHHRASSNTTQVCVCVCVCLLCEIIIRKSAGLGGRLSVTHGQQPSIHAVLTQRHQSHLGHLLVTMYFKTTSLQLC